MATEPLARLAGTPTRLANIVETAALSGGADPHDEMFVRLTDETVDTPASTPDAEQVSYCTARATRFDELAVLAGESARALFAVPPTLDWLDWLGDRHDRVVTTVEGAHGIATRLVLRAGQDTVTVPCATDWESDAISYDIADRFDGATFLDEDGIPLPIRVETSAAELRRLVEAARIAGCTDDIPFVVEDEDLRVALDDEPACVEGSLEATVTGPDCRNRYGDGLVRVATAIDGELTLQTGPGRSLAIVKDRPGFTLRYVVRPRSRVS
jgi:putative intracellular protease/amidase